MTKQEFNLWKAKTESSRNHWVVDDIQLHNRGTYLIYKGGVDGQYIEVTADGKATIGDYTSAIPHIGDALFVPKHSRQFSSREEAMTRLIEHAGLKFLLDILNIPAYQ